MAAGEFAEPIYRLIEEMSGRRADVGNPHEYVLGELIAYLSHDSIRDFVEDFRRHHDMEELELEEDDTETFDPDEYVEPDYHLCMDCQDTYDINNAHICESTQPPSGNSRYFSSLIPEC